MTSFTLLLICWRNHWGEYLKNEDFIQGHSFGHFHSKKHRGFLENTKITLTDKTDGQNPKKKKDY